MKKNIVLLSLSAILALGASADTFGLEMGAAAWASKTSGNIEYKGDSIDLEKDLGYEDLNTNFIWASFEHPIPLIPNIKIQHTKIEDTASKISNVTFDNKRFSGNVSSSLQLNQTDFIAYYELLDNWVNLDVGINGKFIDASVSVKDSVQTANKNLEYIIPMVYSKARFDLPFSGLSAETDLSYISYEDSEFYDFKGGLLYETSFGLGATAGYRMEKLQLDDISDVNSNIEIKGAYAGLFYHF
ncbi:MAG: TIGR04219 family outer membrane beta-barrel protein [Candidatus Paceibacteria bacterium]